MNDIAMLYGLILLIALCQGQYSTEFDSSYLSSTGTMTTTTNRFTICNRTIQMFDASGYLMQFVCSSAVSFADLEIDDLNTTTLQSIFSLEVSGVNGERGPLTNISSKICRFTNLQVLYLPYNQIQNINFNFTTPCVSQLRVLYLERNFLTELPVTWMNQMHSLEIVNLHSNNLICLSYYAFHNISNVRELWVFNNNLRTMELWVFKISNYIHYSNNPVERFSNYFNVDLSNLQSSIQLHYSNVSYRNIKFDDTIYEMYNRCIEVRNISQHNTTYDLQLTLILLRVIGSLTIFSFSCTCDRYYFYRAAFAAELYLYDDFFYNWTCTGDVPFAQKCNYQSSANFLNVKPRLCKINDAEPGTIPVFADPTLCGINDDIASTTRVTLTTTSTTWSTTPPPLLILSNETLIQLENLGVLDSSTADKFVQVINQADVKQNTTIDQTVTRETQENFQQAIRIVEFLIESVNSSLNISVNGTAVFSSTKDNVINHLSQVMSNSSQIYSSELSNTNDSIASITIDQIYIDQLSNEDYLSLFFLPSSMFYYAQEDRSINIISPIVGAHLSYQQSLIVNISFNDCNNDHRQGTYSCVFWEFDRWNNSGCSYLKNPQTNRHECTCNHLTSFALIFTPSGTLPQTFLPSAIAAILSIIGLVLSICLSVYEQTTPRASLTSRYFPLMNMFSLSSTLILFILLTVILFSKQELSINSSQCRSSSLVLALTTYFFVILTFASKTVLGVYYFMTIFVRFALPRWTAMPGKWFFIILLGIVLCALIPTIVASVLAHSSTDVLVQYESICWFSSNYLVKFITVPVSIFVGINVIIIGFIIYRLIQFIACTTTANQKDNKRTITAICIGLSSSILLGVAWIIGPLLGEFVDQNGKTSSTVGQGVQWVFAVFIGLEGVWVLIVNIVFYLNQRPKRKHQDNYGGH